MLYVFNAKVTICTACECSFLNHDEDDSCPHCEADGSMVEYAASSEELQAHFDSEADWPNCEPHHPLFPNPNGEAVVAIQPEIARLLAEFFTGTSSQGSLAAVHIHPRSPSGSALIVRPWQGDSELSDRALAAQLEPFIRQLLEVRRESHNQAEDLTSEDTENTKGETGNG